MKQIVVVLLLLCMVLSLGGCGEEKPAATTAAPTEPTTEATEATTPWETGKEALDGKKVIFLGNSYTFCGQNVMTVQNTEIGQAERTGDKGFFYQLCKANGLEVEVTNWSFGSHSIKDFFDGPCDAGRECQGEVHEYCLKDRYFDYVVLQCNAEGSMRGMGFLEYLKEAMDPFIEANPNVKFLMHVPHQAYVQDFHWIDKLQELTDADIRIANWGELCYDVVKGTAQVPGATQEYTYHSFVINWSEKDGFHQNILAGYLTSLMVYCAITGESAVGQPWEFTNDATLNPKFGWERAKKLHYSYNDETNFIEIFQSEADMHGLQQLADQYLAKYNGGN